MDVIKSGMEYSPNLLECLCKWEFCHSQRGKGLELRSILDNKRVSHLHRHAGGVSSLWAPE
jgi:hypothetical protein